MSIHVTYSVKCDECSASTGWSYTPAEARWEARRDGWVRKRQPRGKYIDLCDRCVKLRAEEKQDGAQP